MVRKIDAHCQAAYEPEHDELRALGELEIGAGARFYKGEGCYFCSFTGYHGRTGIFEVLAPSDEFKQLIMHGASHTEMLDRAMADGFRTMRRDGTQKALSDMTTPFEVLRSVYTL